MDIYIYIYIYIYIFIYIYMDIYIFIYIYIYIFLKALTIKQKVSMARQIILQAKYETKHKTLAKYNDVQSSLHNKT